ncbi:uncharacterized protein LOC135471287 [Liolophura sinensis]|uniref:uncharacterized protein LOC135471287 n=1 Tax=Liolophura sinensis TaxID=3198878 RepID=UPI0031586126
MEHTFDEDYITDAPLFKTMEPLEPIHHDQRLRWDHRVNLIGEKVVDPVIHCCEKCTLPILIYGRMIPCKHVFCLDCAKKTEKSCARCEEPVQRVEQSALGTVFVCIYGGTKLGVSGCRRTYLSQRDLQAHVDHRHLKRGLQDHNKSHAHAHSHASVPAPPLQEYVTATPLTPHPVPMDIHRQMHPPAMPDPAMYQRPPPDPLRLPPPVLPTSHPPPPVQPHQLPPQGMPQTHVPPPALPVHRLPGMPPPLHTQPPLQQHTVPPSSRDSYATASIPVMASNRGNLISVPIQDERTEFRADYQTQPPPNYPHLTSVPPPVSFNPSQPPTHHPPPVHYPPTTMTPTHQPPPVSFAAPPPITHGPPPHYSAPQMSKPGLPPPVSHPPPLHTVPPPLQHLQPPHPSGPPGVPMSSAPITHHQRPGVPPPRMGPPVSQPHHGGPPPRYASPHQHYDDTPATPPYGQTGGQSPRLPWSGPPNRLPPPPHTPVSSAPPNLVPPQGRPGNEGPYKQYY